MDTLTPKKEAKEIMLQFAEAIPMCEGTGTWDTDIEDHFDSVKNSALIMVNRLIIEIRSKFWYDVRREIENMTSEELLFKE